MCAQHLGHFLPPTLLNRLHSLPEPYCRSWVVARFGHHHQSDVISLALLLSSHGQIEEQVLQVVASYEVPEAKQRQAWKSPSKEEQAPRGKVAYPGG